jgi:hypothetical protein
MNKSPMKKFPDGRYQKCHFVQIIGKGIHL